MKITKRGTPPSEEVWIGVCNKCHSEAEAKRSELTNIHPADYKTESYSWEKCPVCGESDDSLGGSMLFYKKDNQ